MPFLSSSLPPYRLLYEVGGGGGGIRPGAAPGGRDGPPGGGGPSPLKPESKTNC